MLDGTTAQICFNHLAQAPHCKLINKGFNKKCIVTQIMSNLSNQDTFMLIYLCMGRIKTRLGLTENMLLLVSDSFTSVFHHIICNFFLVIWQILPKRLTSEVHAHNGSI